MISQCTLFFSYSNLITPKHPNMLCTCLMTFFFFFIYENFALSKETYIAKKKLIRVMPPQGMLKEGRLTASFSRTTGMNMR